MRTCPAASDHLAIIQPRVKIRLTAELQLQTKRTLLLFKIRDKLPMPRCFQPRARLAISPSDAPSNPARSVTRSCQIPEPIPSFSRQRKRIPRLQASFINKCSQTDPFGFLPESPPPFLGFSHRQVSFQHFFALPMFSHEKARPPAGP